ncbi:MAG: FAD-dependent oxidoreductase [Kordiimonadaceae bacterium]|nr:FAD-dependent oxidoreductase [Kordiimonadaceae bacterium]
MGTKKQQNRVIIIGAGIVGLTSAYLLAKQGFRVTVLDKNKQPADGTSKGNAGQLIYNFGAMGSSSFLRNLPNAILKNEKTGIIVSELWHPRNWNWVAAFIGQCTSKAWNNNSLKLIEMAHRSRKILNEFRHDFGIDFNWRKDGKINLHETYQDLVTATKVAEFQQNHGGNHRIISKEECLEKEPALKGSTRHFAGGTYLPDAEIGDCRLFCQQLAEILKTRFNCQFHFNTEITNLRRSNNKIIAAESQVGIFEADFFINCAGILADKLLSGSFKGKKPLIGIKGISLTFEKGKSPPKLSVTDSAGKFVMCSLGEKVRVAGYAIFSNNLAINPMHILLLKDKAISLMPDAAKYNSPPEIWTGLRPQTPDDLPMIGKAGAENLFVNAGHGSSGWILAFGAAEKLLKIIKE